MRGANFLLVFCHMHYLGVTMIMIFFRNPFWCSWLLDWKSGGSEAKIEENRLHLKLNFRGSTFSSTFMSVAPFGTFSEHDLLQEPFRCSWLLDWKSGGSEAKIEENRLHLKLNFRGSMFSSTFMSVAPFGTFSDHDLLQEPFLMFLTPEPEIWWIWGKNWRK